MTASDLRRTGQPQALPERGPALVFINAEMRQEEGGTVTHLAGIVVSKRKKFEEEIIAAKKAAELALYENTSLREVGRVLSRSNHTEKSGWSYGVWSVLPDEFRRATGCALRCGMKHQQAVLIVVVVVD